MPKLSKHCMRNTILPYEPNVVVLLADVILQKNDLSKISRKKINLINQLKYCENKFFCVCIDVCMFHESNDIE